MLDINDVPLEEQWRLTAFEVMKYNPKFRNLEGHYLKKEWTEFEIGKIFDGVELIYEDYKVVEDKYILHNIRDQELEKFYTELKGRMTLNLNEAQMAARLILRGALYGRFYCKGNKEIGVRFGYDYYMFFNVPEKNKKEIRTYIEKEIRLFTSR